MLHRLSVLATLLIVLGLIGPAFSAAQPATDPGEADRATGGPEDHDEATPPARVRAQIHLPADGSVARATLVLGGSTVGLTRLHEAVIAELAASDELVATPLPIGRAAGETDHPLPPAAREGAVRRESLPAEDQPRFSLAAIEQLLTTLREQHGVGEGVPLRVVTYGDGAATLARMSRLMPVHASRVLMIAPDPLALPSDHGAPAGTGSGDEADGTRRTPAVQLPAYADLFVATRRPRALDRWDARVSGTFGPLATDLRVYGGLPTSEPLETVLAHVHTAIAGVRVIETGATTDGDSEPHGRIADFDALVAAALEAKVIVFGELHDSVRGQGIARDILAALIDSGHRTAFSLEMFERDVQATLDQYLAGEIDEATFLAQSRPWGNYQESYRPLIQLAKMNEVPVIAANVPRRFARAAARGGIEALTTAQEEHPTLVPRDLTEGSTGYRDAFFQVMGAMSGHSPDASGGGMNIDSFFLSQRIKDDAMAEAVVDHLQLLPETRYVMHLNGRFHSDFGYGMVERMRVRQDSLDILTISIVEVGNPGTALPSDFDLTRADWLLALPATRR